MIKRVGPEELRKLLDELSGGKASAMEVEVKEIDTSRRFNNPQLDAIYEFLDSVRLYSNVVTAAERQYNVLSGKLTERERMLVCAAYAAGHIAGSVHLSETLYGDQGSKMTAQLMRSSATPESEAGTLLFGKILQDNLHSDKLDINQTDEKAKWEARKDIFTKMKKAHGDLGGAMDVALSIIERDLKQTKGKAADKSNVNSVFTKVFKMKG